MFYYQFVSVCLYFSCVAFFEQLVLRCLFYFDCFGFCFDLLRLDAGGQCVWTLLLWLGFKSRTSTWHFTLREMFVDIKDEKRAGNRCTLRFFALAKSLWDSTILDFFDAIFQRTFALKKCGMLQLPGALPSDEEGRVEHVSSPRNSRLERRFPSSNRTRSERVSARVEAQFNSIFRI